MHRTIAAVAVVALALCAGACGSGRSSLSGSIRIDGSTTVAPLTNAIARRFMAEHPGVRISVGSAGARTGFERLCRGESDAADAVEAIERTAPAPAPTTCASARADSTAIPVADDAVVLVVNARNPVGCLTTAQLRQIWHRNSTINYWREVRGIDPRDATPLIAWGPEGDTETHAWFVKAIDHTNGQHRDYNNVLHREDATIEQIAAAPGGIGYVDYPVYEQQRARTVKGLAVDSGGGCVAPSPRTLADGSFTPLDRRLYIYPSARALARPAMAAFLSFYLDNVRNVAPTVGFVALSPRELAASRRQAVRTIAAARRSPAGARR